MQNLRHLGPTPYNYERFRRLNYPPKIRDVAPLLWPRHFAFALNPFWLVGPCIGPSAYHAEIYPAEEKLASKL